MLIYCFIALEMPSRHTTSDEKKLFYVPVSIGDLLIKYLD